MGQIYMYRRTTLLSKQLIRLANLLVIIHIYIYIIYTYMETDMIKSDILLYTRIQESTNRAFYHRYCTTVSTVTITMLS